MGNRKCSTTIAQVILLVITSRYKVCTFPIIKMRTFSNKIKSQLNKKRKVEAPKIMKLLATISPREGQATSTSTKTIIHTTQAIKLDCPLNRKYNPDTSKRQMNHLFPLKITTIWLCRRDQRLYKVQCQVKKLHLIKIWNRTQP